jgi:hypothetical protein
MFSNYVYCLSVYDFNEQSFYVPIDEGTIKTPIPECRLYWCFCLVWCSNFVNSESGQKQSVKFKEG